MAQAPTERALNAPRRPLPRPNATLVAVLVLLSLPSSALAWVPYECSPDFFATQQRLRQALATATPGTLVKFPPVTTYVRHVPYPFPQTDEQVIADFRSEFDQEASMLGIVPGSSHAAAPTLFLSMRALVAIFSRQAFTYTVYRVENWSSSRCSGDQLTRFVSVIRFVDKQTGKEVQAELNETGLDSGLGEIAQPAPLPDIPALIQAARLEYGIEGLHDAQLVTVNIVNTSPAEGCNAYAPCVAFKGAKGAVYILLRPEKDLFGPVKALDGDWYEVGPETYTRDEVNAHTDDYRFSVISFGNLRWAAARRVPKRVPPG